MTELDVKVTLCVKASCILYNDNSHTIVQPPYKVE